MISRRSFFTKTAQGLGVSLLLPSVQRCQVTPSIQGKVMGPNAVLGHRLRAMDFPLPTETIQTDVVIVGGGVAGLSAARYLKKHTNNFLLAELEQNAGGNSMGGSNTISTYPWGAHYLPVPGDRDEELIQFLTDIEVITGKENGLPVYNEYFLCHDPKERLYINHYWQDGIVPQQGIPKADRDEIDRFLEMMHRYKDLKGSDDREAFTIPTDQSSRDANILKLDSISASEFLKEHNFRSEYLNWYVGYCCADDYGSSLENTSAWAMVHYFASRKGKAANAASDAVLTWPEGNYWLVNNLKKGITEHIHTNVMTYDVAVKNGEVEILLFDATQNQSRKIRAKSAILATPQFVNQRLIKNSPRNIDYKKFQYSPWMVTNLTINASLDEGRGERLCWDNVIYGSKALGYVNAMHQSVKINGDQKIITYYKPLLGPDILSVRRQAFEKKFETWKEEVVNDLKVVHKDIEAHIQEMQTWVWGHGMVQPSPGFIWGDDRIHASRPIENKIHFAHSDISGISIFEEAFYQGHKSAKAVLGHAIE